MARIVILVKDKTKAALDKAAAKQKKGMKEYVLWMLGLTIIETGKEVKHGK